MSDTNPSAVETLRLLNSKQISSAELMQSVIERIEAVNPSINAMIAMDREQSMAEAKMADKHRQNGDARSLEGLPITVKDSIDVIGFKATGGSYARENYLPTKDASSIARLRAAGAILIGKTNLPEYSSSYETDNALFGRTNNPIDVDRTPGGSTGGEAALLGADATLVGIGVDGGGSIRVPSHYCGTVGIRPTVGRIPDTGHWPYTRDTGYRDMMCIGPMARYIEDLALLLPIMAGPDGIDPYASISAMGDHREVDLRELRIGFYCDDGLAKSSQETKTAIAASIIALEKAGAAVFEVSPPDVKDATEIFFTMVGADGGIRTRQDLEGSNDRHHAQFRTLLNGFGKPLSVADFFETQKRFFEFRLRVRRFLSNFDAVICPVTPGPAPLHMHPPFGHSEADYYKYEGFNFVHTYAIAGVPSTVVPVAVAEESALPLGVQVVSQPHQEDISLAVASQLESMLGGFVARMKTDL